MTTHVRRSLLTLVALTSALGAQQNIVYYPSNAPSGTKNSFPFGPYTKGVRTQSLIPGGTFGTTPILIQDLYVAHLGSNLATSTQTEGEIVYSNIEIRLGITQLSTLTGTWATNLPTPTVVQTGRLRMRWKTGTWTPLGIQQPFLWLPTSASDNLVVDVIQSGIADTGGLPVDGAGYIQTTAAGSVSRCYLLNWPATQSPTGSTDVQGTKFGFLLGNGAFVGRGFGCTSSAATAPTIGMPVGVWPKIGGLAQLDLAKAGVSVPSAAYLGSNETSWNAVPLPFDLTPIGGMGCNIWIDPIVNLGVTVTNASGTASVPLIVPPLSTLTGVRVFATWAMLDAGANPLGLVTSDYGLLILGV